MFARRHRRQEQARQSRAVSLSALAPLVIAVFAGFSAAGDAQAQEQAETSTEPAAQAPSSAQTTVGGLAQAGVSIPDDLDFPPTAAEAPGAATLEPRNEDRGPDEIVVVTGRTEWRLPDLGSSLRVRREAEAEAGQRIDLDLLPLYDRLERKPDAELFDENPDLRGVGVGMLQVFKVGVGGGNRISDREDQE